MAVKIGFLLLTLAVACTYSGVRDRSQLAPGFRHGLTPPKMEPMALIRPQGFKRSGFNPGFSYPGNGSNFTGSGTLKRTNNVEDIPGQDRIG